MITSLYLKNFALFKEVQVDFEKGLNIITGETGSGKSLLLKSLKYLSGERFSKDYIRENTERCVLEVEFLNKKIRNTIRRVFHQDGKSRSFLNDEPITIEKLKEMSYLFLDYHAQNENQKIFNSIEQIHILDQFAGHILDVEELKKIYYEIVESNKEIQKLDLMKKEFVREQEIIEFQLNEISQIEFNIEEDIEITRRLKKNSNQSEINQKIEISKKSIQYDILENINKIRRNLEFVVNLDSDFHEIMNRFNSLICEIEDILYELDKSASLELPSKIKIQEMNEKLSILEMLKRKYGGSLEAVLAYHKEILDKVESGSLLDLKLKKISTKKNKLENQYKKLGKIISNNRKSVLNTIIPKIEKNLSKLGMENTKFRIDLNVLDSKEFYPFGYDRCEFKIASNKSGKVKLLNRVASGGELSRIQLSLKMLGINESINDTIVFDEIDTGISGKIAEMVGKVMKEISKNQQVLCITHLPQIAGKSDSHFVPKKIINNNEVFIDIKKLSNSEKIEEIAVLISGEKITQSSKNSAIEILKVQ